MEQQQQKRTKKNGTDLRKNQVRHTGVRNLVIDSKILVNRLDRRFDTAEERIRSWNQDCWENYQQPRHTDITTLRAESEKGLKEPLDESERGE